MFFRDRRMQFSRDIWRSRRFAGALPLLRFYLNKYCHVHTYRYFNPIFYSKEVNLK